MRRFFCLLVLSVVFVPALASAESSAQGGTAMTIFQLEKGKTYYFGSERENTYYEFDKDGVYSEISTDPSSSGEADKGTWKQLEDGRIQLISKKRFHDLYSDIMYISAYTGEDLERIIRAKEILRTFLNQEKKDTFTRHEIENLMRYKTKGNVSQNVIGVLPYRSQITRTEIEKFLTDINTYINGEQKSVFCITPYLYQSKVLLAIANDFLDNNDDPVKIQKDIDTAIGPHKWSSQIIEIDQKKFESATANFQHPYKNDLIEEDPTYVQKSVSDVIKTRNAVKIYQLYKGKDQYFTKSGAHTIYLLLQANGSYSESESAHAGIAQTDFGKWSQDADGTLRFVSAKRFKDICAGWLEVRPYNNDEVAALGDLKSLINKFLNTHRGDRFTKKEVMAITKDLPESGSSVPEIYFFLSADFATRQDLEALITSIDRYLMDKEKNVFKITPYQYKTDIFLLPENSMSDIEDVVEYFDNKWHPSTVFVATDKKTFDNGSKKPQPFRYFPELNKKGE